ncbi:SGNH/GDSL hydrolase family protein [Actinomadura flavalba]|uniref:SGNH/GDSL hydrolase family protein n=1 Tax=Actinomadura flavalba TaxID=1120938 RepID=UPI00037BA160|nr:SGNH/GDSL hydrolase family protein [Actinomadura flavalba]
MPARAETPTTYLLALGDSLSVGTQLFPDAEVGRPTDEGHGEFLLASLRAKEPGLKLVKLGCGGETTTTMIDGGKCAYPEGSQLKAALAFLRDHPGQVKYVTLSIGANDAACALDLDLACGAQAVARVGTNASKIEAKLREAGGDAPVYASMTLFNPGLAAWVHGDKVTALASVPLLDIYNLMQRTAAFANGFRIAEVADAFGSHDFTTKVSLEPYGKLPLAVARICAWSTQCDRNDAHLTADGYRQMGGAFFRAMSK